MTPEPTYEGDFQPIPAPSRYGFYAGPLGPTPVMAIGVKTITHSRYGTKLIPKKVVVIEVSLGTSFDLHPSLARALAESLLEFAQSIEDEPRKP